MILDDFQFASDQIDWEGVSANSITKTLMGSCKHWKDSERPGDMVGLTPVQLEVAILRAAGWRNWDGISWAGKPYYQHFLTLTKLLMPRTDIHPDFSDSVKMFCLGLGNKKKGMHMLGSQNCGKSGGSSRIAFTVMAVFPKESAIYFANPFDSASDSTIWGEVEECYEEVIESNHEIFPTSVKYALRKIELVPGIPRAGTMEIRNVKHVGKFKGTKTVKSGEVDGIILLIVDEVNEIYNYSFMRMLANLVSQSGFFALTSQNFKDPGDMGGQVAIPSSKDGGPTTYSELNSEEHRAWESFGETLTIRFNGLKGPNILAGRTIYKYLFTKDNLNYIVNTYGEDSPEYFSQVLSFPMEGDDAKSVLTRSRVNSSMHDDEYYVIEGKATQTSFCDPSFGGGDSAMWQPAEFAPISYLDARGEKHECIAAIFGQQEKLKVSKTMAVREELLHRLIAAGCDTSRYIIGSEFPPEDQVALQCRENNNRFGIPAENFGYDFSMRPDCITSMARLVGQKSIPFDYNTAPIGYQIKSLGLNSVDCCRARSDELAFLTSDLFANQRVRGGQFIATAVLQLSRTRYEIRHGKRMIEKKKDYKARWQNQSPDERDTLMGNTGMLYKLGFRVVTEHDQVRREASAAFMRRNGNLGSATKFKRRVGKRLKY